MAKEHHPKSGAATGNHVTLDPVELQVSSSREKMAAALKDFAASLQRTAERLEQGKHDETFHIKIVHHHGKHGSTIVACDCNGGGGGNGNGGNGGNGGN